MEALHKAEVENLEKSTLLTANFLLKNLSLNRRQLLGKDKGEMRV